MGWGVRGESGMGCEGRSVGLGVRRGEWCLYVYSDNTSLPSSFCLQRIDAQRQARQSSLQRQVRERNAAQLKTWEQNTATQLTEQERLKHQERVKQLQVCARSVHVHLLYNECVCMYVHTYVLMYVGVPGIRT